MENFIFCAVTPAALYDYFVIVIALVVIVSLIHRQPKTFSALDPDCGYIAETKCSGRYVYASRLFKVTKPAYLSSLKR